MPELRWILLGAGILLIAVLWWRESRRPAPGIDEQAPAPDAPAEPAVTAAEEIEDDPAFTETTELEPDDLPSIVATRSGRSGAPADPPIIEFPADAEPELSRKKDLEDVPPLVSYREMGDALAQKPFKLRASRTAEDIAEREREPWVRTQPIDRFEVMGIPRESSGQTAPGADPMASDASEQQPAAVEETSDTRENEALAARKKIVALRLIAAGGRWPARAVVEALQAEGMAFGKYSIFHRERDDGQSIFFVANMVEPGSFDLDRLDNDSFPGISIFAVVPGAVDAPTTFDMMMATSRRLAERLSGQLQDEQGNTLTAQRVLNLREELAHFEQLTRRARMG